MDGILDWQDELRQERANNPQNYRDMDIEEENRYARIKRQNIL